MTLARATRNRAAVVTGFALLLAAAVVFQDGAAGQARYPCRERARRTCRSGQTTTVRFSLRWKEKSASATWPACCYAAAATASTSGTCATASPSEFRTLPPWRRRICFRAEFAGGNLTWRAAPQTRFVVGSSRTFNLPVLLVNRDSRELVIDAVYHGMSMQSASRKLVLPPSSSKPVFLRAVETRLGPSEGKVTLQHGGGELSAPVYFDVRPLVPLRVRILDERGLPAAARIYLTGSDGLAYSPSGSSNRIAAMRAEYFFHAQDFFEIEMPAGETLVEAARGQEYRLTSETVVIRPGRARGSDAAAGAVDRSDAKRDTGPPMFTFTPTTHRRIIRSSNRATCARSFHPRI